MFQYLRSPSLAPSSPSPPSSQNSRQSRQSRQTRQMNQSRQSKHNNMVLHILGMCESQEQFLIVKTRYADRINELKTKKWKTIMMMNALNILSAGATFLALCCLTMKETIDFTNINKKDKDIINVVLFAAVWILSLTGILVSYLVPIFNLRARIDRRRYKLRLYYAEGWKLIMLDGTYKTPKDSLKPQNPIERFCRRLEKIEKTKILLPLLEEMPILVRDDSIFGTSMNVLGDTSHNDDEWIQDINGDDKNSGNEINIMISPAVVSSKTPEMVNIPSVSTTLSAMINNTLFTETEGEGEGEAKTEIPEINDYEYASMNLSDVGIDI